MCTFMYSMCVCIQILLQYLGGGCYWDNNIKLQAYLGTGDHCLVVESKMKYSLTMMHQSVEHYPCLNIPDSN